MPPRPAICREGDEHRKIFASFPLHRSPSNTRPAVPPSIAGSRPPRKGRAFSRWRNDVRRMLASLTAKLASPAPKSRVRPPAQARTLPRSERTGRRLYRPGAFHGDRSGRFRPFLRHAPSENTCRRACYDCTFSSSPDEKPARNRFAKQRLRTNVLAPHLPPRQSASCVCDGHIPQKPLNSHLETTGR